MTPDELDRFLTEQRTCRVATTGPAGPHATPLWFAWHGRALWLTSLVRSQRWADLRPVPELEGAERAFAGKYGGGVLEHDGRHGWLRLVPDRITSWDFRKLPGSAPRSR